MKKFKDFKEEVAMSATGVSGGGPLAGAPPDFPPVQLASLLQKEVVAQS